MILSASRRTDIPSFYSRWFFNRIEEGFVYVRNPINKKLVSKIFLDPQRIDCIVFWTKNPSQDFLDNLDKLSMYNYYFQFTINSYNSLIEQNIPNKRSIIEKFRLLSQSLGKERVIWRYDPILLNDQYTVDYHIKYYEQILEHIYPYTEKCIISFLDLYKKSERNLKNYSIKDLSQSEMVILANEIKQMASKKGLCVETCAEEIDLANFGVNHGKCIDDCLIERISGYKLKAKKDKNQRKICGCIESIDIGEYNTCMNNCLYCYANLNNEKVISNSKMHNELSPLLIGEVLDSDVIVERKIKSFFEKTLFD